MNSIKIDFITKNQVIKWNNSIIIASGRIHENHFVGYCIVTLHKCHKTSWFKYKDEWWSDSATRPLYSLPPTLAFKIHDDEWY